MKIHTLYDLLLAWNGWAKYDNIQVETGVTETNMLSVGREGSQAFAYLTLTPELFHNNPRQMGRSH